MGIYTEYLGKNFDFPALTAERKAQLRRISHFLDEEIKKLRAKFIAKLLQVSLIVFRDELYQLFIVGLRVRAVLGCSDLFDRRPAFNSQLLADKLQILINVLYFPDKIDQLFPLKEERFIL